VTPFGVPATTCRKLLLLLPLALAGGVCIAQFFPRAVPGDESYAPIPRGPGRWVRIEGGLVVNEDTVRTARETDTHSTGTPEWTNAPGFSKDVFTFARVLFQTDPYAADEPGWGRGRRFSWWVDYPDADLNFSYRLQQVTSIRTDPNGRVLRLTDPDLNSFPLLYMTHPGYAWFNDEEVRALRKYLLGGGALFVNDFWSEHEWRGFAAQIRRVLPDRQWTELTTDHPIFNCVYDLRGPMQRLQVPTMQFWNTEHDPRVPGSHLQRVFRGEGSEEMHVRALFDDQGHLLVFAIHNSDVSDGWEREGEHEAYFNQFSEKIAYPLGINIIFYLMSH
jgi:hypothetical protein